MLLASLFNSASRVPSKASGRGEAVTSAVEAAYEMEMVRVVMVAVFLDLDTVLVEVLVEVSVLSESSSSLSFESVRFRL